RRWAERTARLLGALGLGSPAVAEDAQYPLQQTSCPALYVSPARVDDPASEERLGGPGTARAEASAIYLGLIGEWSDAPLPLDSLTVRDATGRPAGGAVVTLGLSTLLQTGPDGVVRFARTEPGPIVVEVTHPRVHTRHVLLDSESGMILTGTETR
ncbi:MAG TPA: carboxypeptidase-like regulatory domain-containing protein, partial [Dongiaceae bacterium]|nr:carboxypeptidase-like regulatory domain-containing protein [Dongiaceae bacterium]